MQDAAAPFVPPDSGADNSMTSSLSDDAIMARFLTKPGFLIARIDQICTAIHGALSSGETLAQAEFLLLLDALGEVPQIVLARAAGVDKSTTAYVLNNLEARGWIERVVCTADRRRLLVSLTAAGAARIGRARADYEALQRQIVEPIAPFERPRLIALLHKLAANPMSPAPLWIPACHPVIGVLDGATSFLWRRLLQLFQAQFLACTTDFNLTLRQFSLLFILSRRPALTQVRFARMFGLDPSTCGVIMRGLVARGLVTHAPSARDRRERLYAITESGRAVLTEVQPLVDRSERLVFRGEAAAEKRWLIRQLQALARAHSHRLRFPGAVGDL
jgi:DNA-binding MarR family transcriptional regulator